MKRILAMILVVTLFFTFISCGDAKQAERKIFRIVERNYDTILKACEEKDEEALLAINGITQVNIVDGYVIVYCMGAGIAPSSQDYGFYYSEENSPITVGCNLGIVRHAADLSPKGDGYECVVDGNTFYTEHIKGNFYFYSNAY